MYNYLMSQIKAARKLKVEKNISNVSLSLFRILIQHICISNAEYINILGSECLDNSSKIDLNFQVLLQASDGTCVDFIAASLTQIAVIKNNSIARFYFEESNIESDPAVFAWLNQKNVSLRYIFDSYVQERNNSEFGHGITSENIFLELDILEYIMKKIERVLPIINGNHFKFPRIYHMDKKIETLKVFDEKVTCYRKIIKLGNGRLKIKCQIQKTLTTSEDKVYEVENNIFCFDRKKKEYEIFDSNSKWSPFVYLPQRKTTFKDFTGRAKELEALLEWFNDFDDSKRCLIYGDGGIGKTTLIIEFLHRVLEGKIATEWKPDIITFYTAKKTKWGINGLEMISLDRVGVADVALQIAELVDHPIDKSWYQDDATGLINKLSGVLSSLKIKKDEHLIVLDNTETMADNDEEIEYLGRQIQLLSKHIGRVILTSRRREPIEARPIETSKWSDDEGADYIQKRGSALNVKAINSAGVSTLRKITRDLNNTPILLDVFVQFANESQASLDSALERVQRLQNRDLGTFLYADVWERINEKEKHFILLLTRFGSEHDQYFLQLCSEKVKLTFGLAQATLEASKGICNISSIDGKIQISFYNGFMRFCENRTINIDGKTYPLEADIKSINRKYKDFLKHVDVEISDIDQRAYVSRYARAARKYFEEGDNTKSIEYYKLAVDDDKNNIWLLEKFANTYFILKDYSAALDVINKAAYIDQNHAEIQFTKGKILARLKDLKSIDCLDLASKLGKPLHLCELQKAHAYLVCEIPKLAKARQSIITARNNVPKDNFYSKFMSELDYLDRKLEKMEFNPSFRN